jgi:hypothetical protein
VIGTPGHRRYTAGNVALTLLMLGAATLSRVERCLHLACSGRPPVRVRRRRQAHGVVFKLFVPEFFAFIAPPNWPESGLGRIFGRSVRPNPKPETGSLQTASSANQVTYFTNLFDSVARFEIIPTFRRVCRSGSSAVVGRDGFPTVAVRQTGPLSSVRDRPMVGRWRCTNRGVTRHCRSIAATWSRLRMRAYIFIALSRL